MEKIQEETKVRFKPYFNYKNIIININEDSGGFNINIKINLDPEKLKKELIDLMRENSKYSSVDINKIILNINYITPSLNGNINLKDKEAHISSIKVGLFTSTTGNFTIIERELIKNILGGKGIGALIVLMFVYLCYSFNKEIKNDQDKIENISLDDSSNYPGWYGNLLFKYPDGDEVANLDLTSENFQELQNKIFKYSKKGYGNKIHILNKFVIDEYNLKLLSNVADDPELYKGATNLFSINKRKQTSSIRDSDKIKSHKKNHNGGKKTKTKNKNKNKKQKTKNKKQKTKNKKQK